MESFNLQTFFIGLLILVAGGLLVVKYKWVADNFTGGISTYDKVKFWGVIGCILGFVVMLNLHFVILKAIIGLFRS